MSSYSKTEDAVANTHSEQTVADEFLVVLGNEQDHQHLHHALFKDNPLGKVLSILGTFLIIAPIVLGIGWRIFVGPVYMVSTASMSPVMPVGSIAIDGPVPAHLQVGDLITFHPPGSKETYTHAIHSINGDKIRTEGAAVGRPDAWVLSRSNIIAKVRYHAPGWGWYWVALPFGAVGMLAIIALRMLFVTRHDKRLVAFIGAVLLVLSFVIIEKPLVRGEVISSRPAANHQIQATVVSTGLLYANITPRGSDQQYLIAPGHIREVTGPSRHGHILMGMQAALGWLGILIVALICLIPAGLLWAVEYMDDRMVAKHLAKVTRERSEQHAKHEPE